MDDTDTRLIQTVVLLNRQYLLTDHLIDTKGRVLQEFEHAIAEKHEMLIHVLEVYSYIFALIDHLVRYQKIAFVLPRFNQKSVEFRALGTAMGDLKDIRNRLQHINNDIENDDTGPLLGAVCWVSNQRQFIAFFHDIGRQRSSPSIILDTHTRTYAQEFCYVCNGVYHDLGRAIEGVHAFNRFVSSQVRLEVDGKSYNPNDHFTALRIEIGRPAGVTTTAGT